LYKGIQWRARRVQFRLICGFRACEFGPFRILRPRPDSTDPSATNRRRVTAGRRARFANDRSLPSIARRIAPARFLAPSSRSRRSQGIGSDTGLRPPAGGDHATRGPAASPLPQAMPCSSSSHPSPAARAGSQNGPDRDTTTQRRSGWVRAIHVHTRSLDTTILDFSSLDDPLSEILVPTLR